MKEYDRVKLITEKDKYAKEGVHKDMDGWICDSRNINGQWLVCFDQYGDLPNIATIPVKEEDLKIICASHERQVGDRVILLAETYIAKGLRKGHLGTLKEKLQNNKWQVHFDIQDGLPREVDIILDGNDFIIDQ